MKWSDRRLLDLFGIELPSSRRRWPGQAAQMAIAVSQAGGLGSIAAAMLTPEALRKELQIVQKGGRPFNVNFFCPRAARRRCGARGRLARSGSRRTTRARRRSGRRRAGGPARAPFDAAHATWSLEIQAARSSASISACPSRAARAREGCGREGRHRSATTVAEARWLEARAPTR